MEREDQVHLLRKTSCKKSKGEEISGKWRARGVMTDPKVNRRRSSILVWSGMMQIMFFFFEKELVESVLT